MSKIMFVVPPFYGHITATLGIGAELIRRGHSVCWVSLKSIDPSFIPKGAHWITPKSVEPHREAIDQILTKQNIGVKISGFEALDFGLDETMLPFARMLHDGLQEAVDAFSPDCIVHDESALAGPLIAVKNGIPYATSITVPPGFFEPELFYPDRQKKLLERMLELQTEMGVTDKRVIFNSDKLILSFTSRELIQPLYGDFIFDGPVTFVGPSIERRPENMHFDWRLIANTNWPTIYVSIGTVLDDIKSSIFKKIVSAFADKKLNIIANTDPELIEYWPNNFVVQKVCPQLEILEKVDLVISHCGFNTINEALYFEKPIIGIPLAWDQFTNADLLVSHECGIKLRHRRMKGATLLDAAHKLLGSPAYSNNASKLGSSLRALGGTESAVNAIENLI